MSVISLVIETFSNFFLNVKNMIKEIIQKQKKLEKGVTDFETRNTDQIMFTQRVYYSVSRKSFFKNKIESLRL